MEDKKSPLIEDIEKDARDLQYGYMVYKFTVHQGRIVGYEEIEKRKVRRI